jgi:plastocyanin
MKTNIGSKIRFLPMIFSVIAILAISNSCTKATDYMNGTGTGSKGSGGPGINEVWIQGMSFSPATISVAAGTTITWTNKDGVAHTVTSDAALFDSGSIGSGGTFSFSFGTAGTYSYHCAIHPSMTGKVVVN